MAPSARRRFPAPALNVIQQAIAQSEQQHDAELCFAVESRLSFDAILAGCNVRQRAEEIFSRLRVWDTENNTGVLLYLLLAERAIEIVADRKIARRIAAEEWAPVHAAIADAFVRHDWQGGVLAGIAAAHALLVRRLPRTGALPSPNELPDRPVLL